MDHDKKDKNKKPEKHGGTLFGQSGPVNLGSGESRSHLDTGWTQSKPYEPSTPFSTPEPPAYEPPVYEHPAYESPYVGHAPDPPAEVHKPYEPAHPSHEEISSHHEEVHIPQTTSHEPVVHEISDANASVSWSPTPWKPRVAPSALIHPHAMVYGNVKVMEHVFIAAGAMIRGENDEPIHIGSESNIQEGVVLKDLPSRKDGSQITQRIVDVGNEKFSLYIGKRVSIAAQAQVHGPAFIGDGVFLGMQSLVFWARVEKGVILEPGCLVMNVTIPAGRFVPAGLKVTTQKMVADLPPLTSKYRFYGINNETVDASLEMLKGYRSYFH